MVRPHRLRWLAEIAVCCWVAPLLAQAPIQAPTPQPADEAPAIPPRFSTSPRIVARLGDGELWHGSLIRALAFSPDEQILASYGTDNRIALWDLDTGKLRRVFTAPPLAVDDAPAKEPGFAKKVPAKAPGFAQKVLPRRVALTPIGPTLQFSGDGKTVAALALSSGQALAWDTASGKLVQQTPLEHAEEDQPARPPPA